MDWSEVGQRFRDFRLNIKSSQVELSDKTGLKPNAICQYEKGSTPASTNYALFLRNEFYASFDWLYDGDVIDRAFKDIRKRKVFNNKEIGQRLKDIRLSKGITQADFGNLIGITGRAVCRIEHGDRRPEIRTALQIKRALNKPLDWIYFGDEIIIPKNIRVANQIKSNQIKSSSKESRKKSTK